MVAAAAVGGFLIVAATGGPVLAGPTANQKCAAAKIKSAGKKAACLLKIYAGVETKGGVPDPLKVQKCKDKLTSDFSKNETKGCGTASDAAAIEAKVDAFVADINSSLLVKAPNKCQAAKLKSASKKATCLTGLESKYASSGIAPDPTKVQKCKDKLTGDFTKNEAKAPGCVISGDAAAIENKVDAFADDVALELACGVTGVTEGACSCGTPAPGQLGFTTGVGSGNCGKVTGDNSPANDFSLACGFLSTGGSNNGIAASLIPDYGTELLSVAKCCDKRMLLSKRTAAQTGSNRNCSEGGCLYGPPLPIVNAATPALSVCVVNKVAQDAKGTATCDTGRSDIDIPLTADVYLTGDQLGKRCGGSATGAFVGLGCATNADCGGGTCLDDSADVQPCPICNTSTGVCNGGPSNGMPCTGITALTAPQYPTSHDCEPAGFGTPLGSLAIPYALTSGTSTKSSADLPAMANVFCGFCATTGGSFQNPAATCASNTDCTTAPFTVCRQRNPGAFGAGTVGSDARTISETGSAAGPIATSGAPAASTLVSVFCVPPTFSAAVDGVGSLPGPGAVALPGTTQLLP